ncbi:MAG: hypothetical protein LBE27_01580 [Deltaproteobacteria bacterium]|jgi:hypothetical protein|nr:hypothetical protein [Deltaproteobacteria bacterium]
MPETTYSDKILIKDKEQLFFTIREMMENFNKPPHTFKAKTIGGILVEMLPEFDPNGVETIYADASNYLGYIGYEKQSFKIAKHQGMSRGDWLFRQLRTIGGENDFPDSDLGDMILSMQNSFASELNAEGKIAKLSDGFLDALPQSLQKRPEIWNDPNIKVGVLKVSKLLDLLSSFSLSEVEPDAIRLTEEIRTFDDHESLSKDLSRGLYEMDLLILTISLKLALKRSLIEFPDILARAIPDEPHEEGKSPAPWSHAVPPDLEGTLGDTPQLAALATLSLDFMKLAETVGKGQMEEKVAIDELFDLTNAIVAGISKGLFERGGYLLESKFGAYVGTLFAPVVGLSSLPFCATVAGLYGALLSDETVENIVKGLTLMAGAGKHILADKSKPF